MNHVDEQGLGDYLAVLWRRKWIVLVVAVLVPTVAVLEARSKPRLFSASTDVLLANAATGVQSPLTSDVTSVMQTEEEIAASPTIAKRVLQVTGVKSRTVGQLSSEASFSAVGSAEVLRISVSDPDPTLATRFANAYANQYIEYRHEFDTSFLTSTRNELQARMDELQRAGQGKSSIYKTLALESQSLLQASALQTVSAIVLRPATGAGQIQPNPTRYGTLGIGVGLILGFALALLWDAIDPRIRTAHDVAALLDLPVLGQLATPPRRLRKTRRLVMIDETGGVHAEGLRILGTNFDFANVDHRAKLVMVTSASEGEGKSTTAANLAIILARTGRRVVLVDLDLRRPIIDRFFDLEEGPGITEVALGHIPLDMAIVQIPIATPDDSRRLANGAQSLNGSNGYHLDEVTTLNVLPSGFTPLNPGEFVASAAIRSVLESLRDRADVVLIDTPPLLEASDTLALSAAVDAVILVTRVKTARRVLLRRTRQVLDSTPVAKLGVVLTSAEREKGYQYDRYGSYYSQRAPVRAPEPREIERSGRGWS